MVLASGDLSGVIPSQILAGMVEKVKYGSTIAALSGADPMLFGNANIVTFDDDPKAQFIEESGAKGSQDIKPGVVTAVPHKAQITYRTSNEFLWADEDYRAGVFAKMSEKAARGLARALDLGVYHRINPLSGAEVTSWTDYVAGTDLRVQAGAQPDQDIEDAAGLVIANDVVPNGLALDPSYAWKLSTIRDTTGRKIYPEIGLTVAPSMFEGLPTSVSNTVSASKEAAEPTGIDAIVGDFTDGIRWGIQRELPFEVIQFGDPDNSGRDLKGHNEVALRVEVVYAWHAFTDRFAVIEGDAS